MIRLSLFLAEGLGWILLLQSETYCRSSGYGDGGKEKRPKVPKNRFLLKRSTSVCVVPDSYFLPTSCHSRRTGVDNSEQTELTLSV